MQSKRLRQCGPLALVITHAWLDAVFAHRVALHIDPFLTGAAQLRERLIQAFP